MYCVCLFVDLMEVSPAYVLTDTAHMPDSVTVKHTYSFYVTYIQVVPWYTLYQNFMDIIILMQLILVHLYSKISIINQPTLNGTLSRSLAFPSYHPSKSIGSFVPMQNATFPMDPYAFYNGIPVDFYKYRKTYCWTKLVWRDDKPPLVAT